MCQKGREPCQAMTEGTKEALGGDRSDLSPEKVRFEFWVYCVWWWVVVVVYSVSLLPSKDVASQHIKFITWNLAGGNTCGVGLLGQLEGRARVVGAWISHGRRW